MSTDFKVKTTKSGGKYIKCGYNYPWYHGGILPEYHTDLYNRMSADIAELEVNGTNTGYLNALRNARHLLVEHYSPDN